MSHDSNWTDWALDKEFSLNYQAPDITHIPAMKRRRMSHLSKMALHSANLCVQNVAIPPHCVFASQHGELTRTVKILCSLVEQGEISPTDFSMSVHNTALGLFSIHEKNKQPATTIAAGNDTFGFALVEACVLLNRFPEVPVLVVYFDEPIPEPINSEKGHLKESLSIALLLNSKGNSDIVMDFKHNKNAFSSDIEDLGKSFLKFFLSDNNKQSVATDKTTWYWQKF